jgi:hypothetical protein
MLDMGYGMPQKCGVCEWSAVSSNIQYPISSFQLLLSGRLTKSKMRGKSDMEAKGKVVAAITTALHLYMEAEQQVAAAQRQAPAIPRPVYSPWAIAGRQAAMDMRCLWQMRLVR